MDVNQDLVKLLEANEKNEFRKSHKTLAWIIWTGLVTLFSAFMLYEVISTKLSDPFITSLEVPVGYRNNSWQETYEFLNTEESKSYYDLQNTTFFVRRFIEIQHKKDKTPKVCFGRSISEENELINKIFDRTKYGSKETFMNHSDGIIVTSKLLLETGYSENSSHIYLYNSRNKDKPFAVPICAIVDKLPSRADLMYSISFFKKYLANGLNKISKYEPRPVLFFVPEFKGQSISEEEIDQFLKGRGLEDFDLTPNKTESGGSHLSGTHYTLNIKDNQYENNDDSVYWLSDEIKNNLGNEIFRIYDWSSERVNEVQADYLSINLNPISLSESNLEDLQQELRKSELDLDYSKIQQQSVLKYILRTVLVFALVSFLFTIFFIFKYTQSIVNKYFNLIRKSYGQIKAMGMPSDDLSKINSHIISIFLTSALKFASIRAVIILIPACLLIWNLELANFNLNHLIIAIGSLFIASVIAFRFLIYTLGKEVKTFVNQDPGDLIYSRSVS